MLLGYPVVDGIVYDPNTTALVCTSSGGPATHVQWRASEKQLVFSESTYQQTQKVLFTVNSTTETYLHFHNQSIDSFNTTYECIVSNSRGMNSSQIVLEG